MKTREHVRLKDGSPIGFYTFQVNKKGKKHYCHLERSYLCLSCGILQGYTMDTL